MVKLSSAKLSKENIEFLIQDDVRSILQYMYDHRIFKLEESYENAQVNEVEASWYLSDLLDLKLIQRYGPRDDNTYMITYKGRQAVRKYYR